MLVLTGKNFPFLKDMEIPRHFSKYYQTAPHFIASSNYTETNSKKIIPIKQLILISKRKWMQNSIQ